MPWATHQPRDNHGGGPIGGKAAVRSPLPLSPLLASFTATDSAIATAAAAIVRDTARCRVLKNKDKKQPPR